MNNTTDIDNSYVPALLVALHLMRNICIPTITCVGIFGNIISCTVFAFTKLKKKPCSTLLISVSLVDVIFLLCLLTSWLDGEVYPLLRSKLACQFQIYMTYVTSFLSVWNYVAVTCERFLATYFPLKCKSMCSKFREKMTVLALICMAGILYLYNFWTTTAVKFGDQWRCSFTRNSFEFLAVAAWIDACLTVVVPFFLITTMNGAVIRVLSSNMPKVNDKRIQKCFRQGNKDSAGRNTQQEQEQSLTIKSNQRVVSRNQVTNILVLVTTAFLVFNFPSHALRLYTLIAATSGDQLMITPELYFIQECANILHYFSFSCNVFLYSFFGKDFRNAVFAFLRCCFAKERRQQRVIGKCQYRLSRFS